MTDYRMSVILLLATVAAAPEGPCDILVKAGNPCVAAHSTVRALYGSYRGPLYRVTLPDATSTDVGVVEAGGFADTAAHDAFCPQRDCVISVVYDQSPQENHLGKRHRLINASKHKISVGAGVPVYGMWFDMFTGMHVDNTTGVPTGNDPESIYAVMSGTHYNGFCCFDYGNSEKTDKDDGPGAMEAIYFGDAHWGRPFHPGNTGAGAGPWVGADLESGMYYGGGNATTVNEQNIALAFPFVSLSLKGRADGFALKGGDATTGPFTTMYDGPRPKPWTHGSHQGSYQPMKKQGAIVLATGGDNSQFAVGSFYEGIIATGYSTDATDAKVKANIVAVGYKTLDDG